jgi:uncharacterized protein YciI
MKRAMMVATLLYVVATAAVAQQSAPAPTKQQQALFELDHFYMAIMHRAPHFEAPKFHQLLRAELAYWRGLADKNDLMLVGPVDNGKDDLAAAMIYRADTPERAAEIAQADPVVNARLWIAEVHPWMTRKGALKPVHQCDFTTPYYLGLLLAGPSFSAEDSPERQEIQQAHLANIKRLSEMGKLVAAGPFEDDIALRGIFVFRTSTLAEALDLTNTDPAVKSGRLKVELYEWKLPAETFAGK